MDNNLHKNLGISIKRMKKVMELAKDIVGKYNKCSDTIKAISSLPYTNTEFVWVAYKIGFVEGMR